MLASHPGGGSPEIGLGLGEMKAFRAVDEHGRKGLARVEPSSLHLADVGDEVGLGPAGLAEEKREPAKEVVVGERLERSFE